jgi:hypothetical protein
MAPAFPFFLGCDWRPGFVLAAVEGIGIVRPLHIRGIHPHDHFRVFAMQLLNGTRWPLVLVCLCLLMGSGCTPISMWRWPWEDKDPFDPALYAKTATARLEAMQQLTKGLASKPPDEQQRIVADLAQRIQSESDPIVRREIVRAMGTTKSDLAGAVLISALQDSNAQVRETACVAWGERGGPESVRALSGILSTDTNLDVRLAATKALGRIKDPGAVPALAVALEDRNPALQYRAVESLRTAAPVDLGEDVDAWRQYAKTGHAEPKPVSVAERFWKIF